MQILENTPKELIIASNLWGTFINLLQNSSKKHKGDTFELFTQQYFQIKPQYSFNKNIWLFSEVPQKVLKHLGLPSVDVGIDLIAKTKEDEYHAIQCKYHSDTDKSVRFSEVASFLTLVASNSLISQGYI